MDQRKTVACHVKEDEGVDRWLTPGLGARVLEDEGDHGEGVGEGVGHAGQLVGKVLKHGVEHRVGAQREVVERVEAALGAQLLQPAQTLRRNAPQWRDADDYELPRAHLIQGLFARHVERQRPQVKFSFSFYT